MPKIPTGAVAMIPLGHQGCCRLWFYYVVMRKRGSSQVGPVYRRSHPPRLWTCCSHQQTMNQLCRCLHLCCLFRNSCTGEARGNGFVTFRLCSVSAKAGAFQDWHDWLDAYKSRRGMGWRLDGDVGACRPKVKNSRSRHCLHDCP